MLETIDQFYAVDQLEKWYHDYNHQVIDLCGMIGTGKKEIIEEFLYRREFENYQVMYLSYNQADVISLALEQYHAYYLDGILYDYQKDIDFNSLKIINPNSFDVKYNWIQTRKKKINKAYKIIIVLNAELCSRKVIKDLCKFGLPIILISDPMMLGFEKSYLRNHDPNISINMIKPSVQKHPFNHFIQKFINNETIPYGNFKAVTILKKKDSNMYNFKFSDIIIAENDSTVESLNNLYRSKILKNNTNILKPGERLILAESSHEAIINKTEDKIKFYLDQGITGTVLTVDQHLKNRRFVNITFQPDFYDEEIPEMVLNRFYLNKFTNRSIQFSPTHVYNFDYCYAITAKRSQYGCWNDITIIEEPYDDYDYHVKVLYTAMTRAKKSIVIIR